MQRVKKKDKNRKNTQTSALLLHSLKRFIQVQFQTVKWNYP